MHDFKRLLIWQNSMDFVVEVYKKTKSFPKEELYGLTQQIRRSAVSIPSNIAEGACRNSGKEFNQFLGISQGSGGELQTQLILSNRLGYLDEEFLVFAEDKIDHLRRQTIKLQNSIKI